MSTIMKASTIQVTENYHTCPMCVYMCMITVLCITLGSEEEIVSGRNRKLLVEDPNAFITSSTPGTPLNGKLSPLKTLT